LGSHICYECETFGSFGHGINRDMYLQELLRMIAKKTREVKKYQVYYRGFPRVVNIPRRVCCPYADFSSQRIVLYERMPLT